MLANGPALPKGHQTWQMNEINALIWPAPKGIGIMDPVAYKRSAKIVATYGKLKKVPGHEAYRTDIDAAALQEPQGRRASTSTAGTGRS